MPNQPKNPSPHARDQNLSKILDTITDDGPASTEAKDQSHAEEVGYASLIEKAYRKSSSRGTREPAATPAKPPREETSPKQRSWRRELTIAGIVGAAAIVALIALYAPWGIKPSGKGSTSPPPVDSSITDLKAIRETSTLLSKRVDALSTESERAVQLLDRKVSGEHETTRKRLSALEQRVAQAGNLTEQLAALSTRLDRLEGEMRERASRDSAMQSVEKGAEIRPSDQRNTQARGAKGMPRSTAPPPQSSPEEQAFPAAAAVGKVDEPTGEPPATRSDLHQSQSEQEPVSATAMPESGSDMLPAADSARERNDDLSDEKTVPLIASEPPSDEVAEEVMDDNDTAQSGAVGSDEGEAGKKWAISLIALASKDKIQALEDKYTAKGVKVEMVQMGRLYALRVPGFADRAEAAAYSDNVKRKLGIGEVWIYAY